VEQGPVRGLYFQHCQRLSVLVTGLFVLQDTQVPQKQKKEFKPGVGSTVYVPRLGGNAKVRMLVPRCFILSLLFALLGSMP
jgi:hypothetical protein